MAYEKLLQSTEWQKRRLYIFERDSFKCKSSNCQTPNSTLEVHHLDYLSFELEPWKYPDDMLITLCSVCHAKEQKRPKAENDLLAALKFKGFLMPDILAFATLVHTDKKFANTIFNYLRKIQNG